MAILPGYWVQFIAEKKLEKASFSIPWLDGDGDAINHELHLFDESQAHDEAVNLWPGQRVFPDGFVPVAGDAIGTGDQYFINTNDGPGGPLYQIDHEQVFDDGYDRSKAVSLVLASYSELPKYRSDE